MPEPGVVRGCALGGLGGEGFAELMPLRRESPGLSPRSRVRRPGCLLLKATDAGPCLVLGIHPGSQVGTELGPAVSPRAHTFAPMTSAVQRV